MNLLKALRYFLHEAVVSLLRSWKVSALAVVTIAVSLFVGGSLLLITSNLSGLVETWRSEAKIVVYLAPQAETGDIAELLAETRRLDWVQRVEVVDAEVARSRFQRSFPSLGTLVEGWEEEPLPASLEIGFDARRVDASALAGWAETTRAHPAVEMIDDDRDWLAQLTALVAVGRGVGFGLGAVLLGAAIFTIASVIRLTAYLYHEEIAIMRVVGATEFFIRGPFYLEGLLQGLLGGLLAVAALYGAHAFALTRAAESMWGVLLLGDFLTLAQQAFLVALGSVAGFAGAVISLRRESLGAPVDALED